VEKTSEQMYSDLLRQIADPTVVEPEVLAGYLRDVERMHSMGRITEWQLQRARDAYAATIERDPRQSLVPPSETVPGVGLDQFGERNLDPISGAPGAHPVGTGLGAAMGGAAAGAAVASVAGPVGTFIGAAVGAVLGGLAGKGVAELVDPTAEEAYWRESFAGRAYADQSASYDDYRPAYVYGARAYLANEGMSFDDAEESLATGWQQARGTSTLEWQRARAATRDAWERASQRR
jgi:hypothetical protein